MIPNRTNRLKIAIGIVAEEKSIDVESGNLLNTNDFLRQFLWFYLAIQLDRQLKMQLISVPTLVIGKALIIPTVSSGLVDYKHKNCRRTINNDS